MKISKFVALCAAFNFSAAAFADTGIATLSNPTGKVLVNQGQGFLPAIGSLDLKVGDRILVGAESTANIDYNMANCHVTINAKSVMVISAKPKCKAGETVAQAQSTMIEPAAGAAVPPPAITPVVLLGGGAAIVGGVILFSSSVSKP